MTHSHRQSLWVGLQASASRRAAPAFGSTKIELVEEDGFFAPKGETTGPYSAPGN
jgi:hypothetical protein